MTFWTMAEYLATIDRPEWTLLASAIGLMKNSFLDNRAL
jgi:hypothetical protein